MLILEAHPVARSKAIAASDISAGTCIMREVSLAAVLLPAEKGRRCDACFRRASTDRQLRRCSGCAAYWYCNAECQKMHWKTMHQPICKRYAHFVASAMYQALADHERMDAILLSHLLARIAANSEDVSSHVSVFLSLLPGPMADITTPPVCAIPSSPDDLPGELYARFGNNNFAIQSHLYTVGHGIFPNASRFFNHSCMPNAAAKYIFSEAQPVTMEVIALSDIEMGEEICITYLDPALLQTRKQVFEVIYGFLCSCQSCQQLRKLGDLPSSPVTEGVVEGLGKALQRHVGLENGVGVHLPYKTLDSLPKELWPVLQEGYMTLLSEIFSRSSHEGLYSQAHESGLMLLALYLVVYPKNYPQIGAHLVEMAKTRWNELVTSSPSEQRTVKDQISVLLRHASEILNIIGAEGDEEGRLQEAKNLETLLGQ